MNTARTTLFLFCFFTFLPIAIGADQKPGKPIDVPVLIEKLKDPENFEKQTALETLARVGKDARSAVPNVAALLKDKDPFLRVCAARTLLRIDSEPCLSLPILIDALRDKNYEISSYAMMSFRSSDAASVPALIALFRDENKGDTVLLALQSICNIGPKAKPYLVSALSHSDPYARFCIEKTLECLDPN